MVIETTRSAGHARSPPWRPVITGCFPGQLVSVCGTWMQIVAQSFLVLQLTDSATALGLATAARFLPVLLLGPWAGLVADGWTSAGSCTSPRRCLAGWRWPSGCWSERTRSGCGWSTCWLSTAPAMRGLVMSPWLVAYPVLARIDARRSGRRQAESGFDSRQGHTSAGPLHGRS